MMIQDRHGQNEEWIEIPIEQINPGTLMNMVREFVTRNWDDLGDSDCTLEEKIEQVMRQLRAKRARVTFDLTTETWNIVEREGVPFAATRLSRQ